MASTVLNTDNYCIEEHDGDPNSCTPLGEVNISGVSEIDPQTYALLLSASLAEASYTIKLSGLSDLDGRALILPDYADFEVDHDLRVITAYSDSDTSLVVVFSKALRAGPDTNNSADCSSAAECALRYQLSGPSELGPITNAVLTGQNRVRLSHSQEQSGGINILTAANALDGDGFDNDSWGSIFSADGEALGATPADRAGFLSAGSGPGDLHDGPLLVDPFADETSFGYLFAYRGRVHLGPSQDGRGAMRMWPDGSSPELIDFRIVGDQVPTGTTSGNRSDPPYPSIGQPDCGINSPDCGPDNENGRGLFASSTVDGQPWLIIGGSKSNGHLDYVYVTADSDSRLDLQYVDLSMITGPATRTFSEIHVFGPRAYMGFPDTGGKRPYLLNLMNWPIPGTAGLEPAQNGNTDIACDPAIHDACFLAANLMPYIGTDGDPSNDHPVVGIDLIADFSDRLYLGNNGGLVRSTTNEPLDYANYPEHWVHTVPSASEYVLFASHASDLESALRPRDKAWSGMVEFQGRIYLARNVETGEGGRAAQLWRCDPSIQTTPPPASATDCDPDDWSLIAANTQGTAGLTQFNNPENNAISLLAVNGNKLYVGFDNAMVGVTLYSSSALDPLLPEDFEGASGCTAGGADCQSLGGQGFGDPGNIQIIDHVSIDFAGRSYLYIMVGDQNGLLKVYRSKD